MDGRGRAAPPAVQSAPGGVQAMVLISPRVMERTHNRRKNT